METRPTTDRIKETLFNIIQNDLYGCVFLDLFAGSGAIGIEALSRGAKRAVFIDNGNRQISCIRDNLRTTKLEEKAEVMASDVFSGLSFIRSVVGLVPSPWGTFSFRLLALPAITRIWLFPSFLSG